MAKLPRGLSGREVADALGKSGFRMTRQKGSHIVMRRDHPAARVTIPDHREVRVGTLAQILRDAGIDSETFLKLLD